MLVWMWQANNAHRSDGMVGADGRDGLVALYLDDGGFLNLEQRIKKKEITYSIRYVRAEWLSGACTLVGSLDNFAEAAVRAAGV